MFQRLNRKLYISVIKAYGYRVSDKESSFGKERALQAEKVAKEEDPFLNW